MPYQPHASVPSAHTPVPLEPCTQDAPFVELNRFTNAAYSGPLFSPACAETDSIANTQARPRAACCRTRLRTEIAGAQCVARSETRIDCSIEDDRKGQIYRFNDRLRADRT